MEDDRKLKYRKRIGLPMNIYTVKATDVLEIMSLFNTCISFFRRRYPFAMTGGQPPG